MKKTILLIKKLPDSIIDNSTGSTCIIPYCRETTVFASCRCYRHKNWRFGKKLKTVEKKHYEHWSNNTYLNVR